MFNLADEEVLTHRGQTLNEIEKFDDPRSDNDDDDEENPLKSKGNLDGMYYATELSKRKWFMKSTFDCLIRLRYFKSYWL